MNFVGLAAPRTPHGFDEAAREISCDPAVLNAVLVVETGGHGFDRAGRPKALFEPHVFYRLLHEAKKMDALRAAVDAGLGYPKWGTRPYPEDSYPRIEAACRIEGEIALQATSWGLPQILGMNHSAAGYGSAGAMFEAFKTGEDEQLMAMARFIKHNRLAQYLIAKDWAAFASGYNGPGYKQHNYNQRLAEEYRRSLVGFAADRQKSVVERST